MGLRYLFLKSRHAAMALALISLAALPTAASDETVSESRGPVEAGLDPRIQDDRWVCFAYDEQNQFYFGSAVHKRRASHLATTACHEAGTHCWPVGCYRTDLYR